MALNVTPSQQLSNIGTISWNINQDFLALGLRIGTDTSILASFNKIASPESWAASPGSTDSLLEKDAVIFNAYLKKKK